MLEPVAKKKINVPSILHNFPTNLNPKKSKSSEFGLMIHSGTIQAGLHTQYSYLSRLCLCV